MALLSSLVMLLLVASLAGSIYIVAVALIRVRRSFLVDTNASAFFLSPNSSSKYSL